MSKKEKELFIKLAVQHSSHCSWLGEALGGGGGAGEILGL